VSPYLLITKTRLLISTGEWLSEPVIPDPLAREPIMNTKNVENSKGIVAYKGHAGVTSGSISPSPGPDRSSLIRLRSSSIIAA